MPYPFALRLGALLAVAAGGLTAESSAPVQLRYQFTPGQTNAYRVSFETVANEQPATVAGVVFVHVRRVEEGVATLAFSGSLMPRIPRGQAPFMGMLFRPGSGTWMPRPITLQPNVEIRVDDRGRMVRQSVFGASFPPPFGSIMNLFFQPVPATATTEWRAEAEVLIEDESASDDAHSPPSGPYDPTRSTFQLAATRIQTARLVAVTETTATIETRVELVSLLRSGAEPRLRAVIEGQVDFDRQLGWIRSLELHGQSVTTTATLTQRRPMSLSVRRLEGDELARELKALAPAEPTPARAISGEELTGLLRDLGAFDENTRMQAINRLQMAEVEAPTPELLAAAVKLAGSADFSARTTAGHLLGLYGTSGEVPAMLKLLAWSQPGNQREVIEGLRRLQDPRAIGTLADLIARGSYEANFLVEVLKSFGSAAESAGLKLLQERHAETRRHACELLGEIGSIDSLEPLRQQMLDPDQQLSQVATGAVRAVQQRTASVEPE
ncbi:MAG: HEAT repeat domain-containing protein [Limisphaerales bacterium]